MKLYYTPGACSLSPHIALRESGLSFELERVNLQEKKTQVGADYKAINPKGYVPALALDDGTLITEGAVIVQYVADRSPDAKLAPPAGTIERLRLQEWLNFIATELHKGFGPVNNPKANDAIKEFYKDRLVARFGVLGAALSGHDYLVGDRFTVADGYAYYTLRNWRKLVGPEFGDHAPLRAYFDRIGHRESVQAALAAEGLS
jgi:glutathione S-transferase